METDRPTWRSRAWFAAAAVLLVFALALDARDRTRLVITAYEAGLVTPD